MEAKCRSEYECYKVHKVWWRRIHDLDIKVVQLITWQLFAGNVIFVNILSIWNTVERRLQTILTFCTHNASNIKFVFNLKKRIWVTLLKVHGLWGIFAWNNYVAYKNRSISDSCKNESKSILFLKKQMNYVFLCNKNVFPRKNDW